MINVDLNRELIGLLKQGKEQTFREVFISYFGSLEVFARTYVENGEVARDIVQEVFLNLWSRRFSLPAEINLKAYLYQSTRNGCLNYLKRLKVRVKYEKRAINNYNDLLLNYEALLQLNLDMISYKELLETLETAVSQLPGKCKEVFELSRYDGMKNREIAEKLNISVKAVEGHITRALKELKEKLNKYYSTGLILFLSVRKKFRFLS